MVFHFQYRWLLIWLKTVDYSFTSNFVDFAFVSVTEHAKSLKLGLGLERVMAMPLDKESCTSPIFSARGFEDKILLVAVALLLGAYIQWFLIGSYPLGEHFYRRRRCHEQALAPGDALY